MEMPQLTDAHRKLDLLVGVWKGEEKLNPSPWDPEGGTAKGTVKNRTALDGFAVIQDYEQDRGPKGGFKGHGVFQWNPKESTYVMYWWDSMGFPCSEHKGTFEGKVLTLKNQSEFGHSRAVFDLSEPGAYRFRMETSQDGTAWATFMEGNYRKEG